MALGGLRRIGPKAKRAAPSIRELLADKDDGVRNRAREALAAIGEDAPKEDGDKEKESAKEADKADPTRTPRRSSYSKPSSASKARPTEPEGTRASRSGRQENKLRR
jgi:HEAT repeat protein